MIGLAPSIHFVEGMILMSLVYANKYYMKQGLQIMISRLKPIKDFPKYLISDKGIIYSLYSNKTMKPGYVEGDYLRVYLSKHGKDYTKKIHRLVLEAFVGPCPDNMETCHNNGNKLDNRLENLRWDTHSHNARDSIKHGTFAGLKVGENSNSHKLTENDVRVLISMYQTGLFTQTTLVGIFNIRHAQVSRIVNKQSWRHLWIKMK